MRVFLGEISISSLEKTDSPPECECASTSLLRAEKKQKDGGRENLPCLTELGHQSSLALTQGLTPSTPLVLRALDLESQLWDFSASIIV